MEPISRPDRYGLEFQHLGRSDLYFFCYDAESNHISSSVKGLAGFLQSIYPTPPRSIFEYRLDKLDWPDKSLRQRIVKVRDDPGTYSRLKLVGHSLGAVVIRSLVVDHVKAVVQARSPSTALAAMASLFLFAPAHGGFQPAGIKGMMFNALGEFRLGRVLLAVLSNFRSYRDLEAGSQTLLKLQEQTELLAERHPEIQALSARIAWGKLEDVVRVTRYACDLMENEDFFPDQNHLTICKPQVDFTSPLSFVAGGEGQHGH